EAGAVQVSLQKQFRKPFLDAAIEAASDALSLEELGSGAAMRLAEAVGACDAILFGFGPDGMPVGIGNKAAAMAEYVEHGYIRDDPHDRVGRRDDATVRIASELFDRNELHQTRAYREFFRPGDVE